MRAKREPRAALVSAAVAKIADVDVSPIQRAAAAAAVARTIPTKTVQPPKQLRNNQASSSKPLPSKPLPSSKSSRSRFRVFGRALKYARSLKLQSTAEWEAWRKTDARPIDIPTRPSDVYKDLGWQGYSHWLGLGCYMGLMNESDFLPFAKAIIQARSFRMSSREEWHAWSKAGRRPANLPSNPNKAYAEVGWQGWGHWLGTGNVAGFNHLKKKEMGLEQGGHRATQPSKGAAPRIEQKAKHVNPRGKQPTTQPAKQSRPSSQPPSTQGNPQSGYSGVVWRPNLKSWVIEVRKKYGGTSKDLKTAVEKHNAVCRDHGWLDRIHAWRGKAVADSKRPISRPDSKRPRPQVTPGGKGPLQTPGRFLPFKDAAVIVQSLGLSGKVEWKEWCRNGLRPHNLPSAPDEKYREEGWIGWSHWLGTGNQQRKQPRSEQRPAGLQSKQIRTQSAKEPRSEQRPKQSTKRPRSEERPKQSAKEHRSKQRPKQSAKEPRSEDRPKHSAKQSRGQEQPAQPAGQRRGQERSTQSAKQPRSGQERPKQSTKLSTKPPTKPAKDGRLSDGADRKTASASSKPTLPKRVPNSAPVRSAKRPRNEGRPNPSAKRARDQDRPKQPVARPGTHPSGARRGRQRDPSA